MITPEQITYSEPEYTRGGGTCHQDIILNDEVIGCLVSRSRGLHLEESYQYGTTIDQIPEGARWEESSDEDNWGLVQLETLEEFLVHFQNKNP